MPFETSKPSNAGVEKNLMSVLIVSVAHPVRRAGLADEIKTRIYKVLTVREKEFHQFPLRELR